MLKRESLWNFLLQLPTYFSENVGGWQKKHKI